MPDPPGEVSDQTSQLPMLGVIVPTSTTASLSIAHQGKTMPRAAPFHAAGSDNGRGKHIGGVGWVIMGSSTGYEHEDNFNARIRNEATDLESRISRGGHFGQDGVFREPRVAQQLS